MNQTIETKGNDIEVKPSGGGLVLTKQQKDFADNIGCEVICSGSGNPERGINLGLAFSKTLAKDDILKPTGVNVFFLNEHAIIEIAFDVVDLVLPTKELKSELAKSVERLCHALINDREYFYSWQSNIAVAFQDAYRNWNDRMPAMASINIHEISNEAAINFLKSFSEAAKDNAYEAGAGISTKHTSQCLRKAADDEPIFVLRSKDPTAPDTVRSWVMRNKQLQPVEKLEGAFALANEMDEWFRNNCI